jgi:hypothetical protein
LALLAGSAKGETTNLGEYGPFEKIEFLAGTLDGSSWGFWAEKPDGKEYLIINGKEWGPYERAWWPPFSSDGSAVFYAATKIKPSYYRIERIVVPGK